MSQQKQLRLDQAKHNEELCISIDAMGKFPDWVITTAFYAAIHYLKFKIFPLTVENTKRVEGESGIKIIATFEDYFAEYFNSKDSRHSALNRLVKTYCRDIAVEYKMLFDICWSARYTNYAVDPDLAIKAKEILGLIKTHCTPPVKAVAEVDAEDSSQK